MVERYLCIPEKKSALLSFLGATQEKPNDEFDPEMYLPSVMIHNESKFYPTLVRYISHIKISYMPDEPLEAKGYLDLHKSTCL